MSMNEQLNKYQQNWLKNIFEPYVQGNPNQGISYPFFTGVSDEYENASKRIMIVGQETRGWSQYKPDWTTADSQKWAIDYLRYQLHYSDDEKFKESFGRRNSSPFWSFFKAFSKENVVPCWNNIDKAQRYYNGKTMSLTVDIECILNEKLPNSNETIFQKEIEITKPNVIVFITGPNYHTTMEKAMNLGTNSLQNIGLTTQTGCIDISSITNLGIPTFWTYHPRYISSKKNELCRDEIVSKIMEGFHK